MFCSPVSTIRWKFRGESYLLSRYRLGQGRWLSLGIYYDAQASKNPPGAIQPECAENYEGIFDDRPGRFRTRDRGLKSAAFFGLDHDRGLEPLFSCFELPVGKLRCVQPQRISSQIFDSPTDGPQTLSVCWIDRDLPERYFRR